eukprot:g1553.t1
MAAEDVPAILHAAAGGLGGILALSLLYPMDNLRTRMQVQQDSLPNFEGQQGTAVIITALRSVLSMSRLGRDNKKELREALALTAQVDAALRGRLEALTAADPAGDGRARGGAGPDGAKGEAGAPTHGGTAAAATAADAAGDADAAARPPQNTLQLLRDVVRQEGVSGLYKGLVSGLTGMGVAWASYYYFYNIFTTRAMRAEGVTRATDLGNSWRLLIGAGAGTVTCVVTNPLWVVNTRVKLRPKDAPPSRGLVNELLQLFREEGLPGLFQGLAPSLVLVSNPAVQFMSAELLKRAYVRRLVAARPRLAHARAAEVDALLGPLFHFCVGALSKLVSTLVTYPYQVVKTRMQRAENQRYTTVECISRVLREEGPGGFYKGMEVKMGQTVLTSAFMFAIYDATLKLLVRLFVARQGVVSAVSVASATQVNIPFMASTLNGFVLGEKRGIGATKLDAFLGPFCEDSLLALPTLTQLASRYNADALEVRVHIFPLPYNQGSWLCAQACAGAVEAGRGGTADSRAADSLRAIYAQQMQLKDLATWNYTVPAMIARLADVLTAAFGTGRLERAALLAQLDFSHQPPHGSGAQPAAYDAAKRDWKYGCSRGVYATPTFLINNVAIAGSGEHPEGKLASLSIDEWQAILDPIVNSTSVSAPR